MKAVHRSSWASDGGEDLLRAWRDGLTRTPSSPSRPGLTSTGCSRGASEAGPWRNKPARAYHGRAVAHPCSAGRVHERFKAGVTESGGNWIGLRQPSVGAAGFAWSKAPGLVRMYAEGAVIRSKQGLFLAHPDAGGRPVRRWAAENYARCRERIPRHAGFRLPARQPKPARGKRD